ncbi:hypothetical protein HK100_008066 [Physocladia obscura]|uniref:Uncharacterized protein n=1 Tax=Physocladia obscura TaxID=109957 RepID=A0AAD5T4Y6_9FUNG|nr:hypothetical protein HK100_008066 [Physocladia obscura]
MSLLLLISTLLLIIPTTPLSLSSASIALAPMPSAPTPNSQMPSPADYLPLLIPLVYSVISIAAKRAYSTCSPQQNPQLPESVPPAHFLKLYNFAYIVRTVVDVAALIHYPSSSSAATISNKNSYYSAYYWRASVIRAPLSVATPGVGLFFSQLFPCTATSDEDSSTLNSELNDNSFNSTNTMFDVWISGDDSIKTTTDDSAVAVAAAAASLIDSIMSASSGNGSVGGSSGGDGSSDNSDDVVQDFNISTCLGINVLMPAYLVMVRETNAAHA